MYIYICIYIYIYREREGYIYIYMYTHTYTYTYVYPLRPTTPDAGHYALPPVRNNEKSINFKKTNKRN